MRSFLFFFLAACSPHWSGAPSLSVAREGHSAVLLADGRVLVMGGMGEFGDTLVQTELWTPGDDLWQSAAPLRQGSAYHSATVLPDGRVLVLGGQVGQTALKTSWLYSPEADLWTERASMRRIRSHHSATLLPDGRVLVFGGSTDPLGPGPEIYDVDADSWTPVETEALTRTHHQALWTGDRLLISGGLLEDDGGAVVATDQSVGLSRDGAVVDLPSMLQSRAYHGGALTADGDVLVVGGSADVSISPNWALSTVERWDGQEWTAFGSLAEKTVNPNVVSLGGAGLLVIGGASGEADQSVSAVSLIDTDDRTVESLEPLSERRRAHASVRLQDGRVLVIAGNIGRWPTASSELFSPKSVYR